MCTGLGGSYFSECLHFKETALRSLRSQIWVIEELCQRKKMYDFKLSKVAALGRGLFRDSILVCFLFLSFGQGMWDLSP